MNKKRKQSKEQNYRSHYGNVNQSPVVNDGLSYRDIVDQAALPASGLRPAKAIGEFLSKVFSQKTDRPSIIKAINMEKLY